jgi:PAS domain S-box-containing protein
MNPLDLFPHVPIEKLDALLRDMGPYAVFLASAYQGKYVYVSEAMRNIDGYAPELHLEGGLAFTQSIVHPEDYAHCLEYFVRCMQKALAAPDEQRELFTGTNIYRVKHAEGHYVWVTNSFVLLDYEDGKPNTLLGFYRRVTEERKREEFLLRQLKGTLTAAQFSKIMDEYHRMAAEPTPGPAPAASGLLPVPFTNKQSVKVTAREKEVLQLISDGLSDKQVADRLHISPYTAINHRKNLIFKYGVKNTAHLIKEASKAFRL